MNIPKRHWDASWDVLDEVNDGSDKFTYLNNVKKLIENWDTAVARGDNLLLYGPYGTGKSALAALILFGLLEKKVAGYWLNAMRIQEVVINNWVHEDRVVWDHAHKTPVLVLDDLILKDTNKFQDTQLEVLIRSRIDSMLPTIITSNMGPEAIEGVYPALGAVMKGSYWSWEVSGNTFRDPDRKSSGRTD